MRATFTGAVTIETALAGSVLDVVVAVEVVVCALVVDPPVLAALVAQPASAVTKASPHTPDQERRFMTQFCRMLSGEPTRPCGTERRRAKIGP